MDKINVGLIGIGNMGFLHLMNSLYMKDVNVVAVADRSKRLISKAKNLGVKNTYSDYDDLYEKEGKNLDAVIISLPNYLHYDSIKKGLESGVNVFIEKPMAVNVDECKSIIELTKKTGRQVMPGHVMRYHNAITKMKDEVEKGRIGNVEIVTIESIQNGPLSHGSTPQPVPDWWFDPAKSGGGVLLDLGYHLIDLFNYFSGDSTVIFSQLGYKYNLPIEDGATVILNSKNSTRGVINVGWFEKSIFPRFNFRMMLHGSADYLSSDDIVPKNVYVYAIKEGINNFILKISGKKIHPLSYTYHYEGHYKELRHFYDCLIDDVDFPITAYDGLRTVEGITQAYTYAKTHASIGDIIE